MPLKFVLTTEQMEAFFQEEEEAFIGILEGFFGEELQEGTTGHISQSEENSAHN